MSNHNYLAILGRQPALGLAELESLYGSANVTPCGEQVALVSTDEIVFERLGGSVKLAEVVGGLDKVDWGSVERYLVKNAASFVGAEHDGKLQLGISAYGFRESAQRVNATGLSIKKALRKADYSVRLVPNQEPALNSAQVYHNHLAGSKGLELIIASDGQRTVVARTTRVQDIDSYTLRDRSRPKRDSRVGMLPPKLAQTIINLATSDSQEQLTILDPFCGTGVVLQEALLMGYNTYGSDLEPRMIDYSGENLDWLDGQFDLDGREMRLEVGDATNHIWEPVPDAVACESYLGRPFTNTPDRELLNKNATDCNLIIKKFLTNIHPQLTPGTRLCIAVPAWQVRKGEFKHLPVVDSLEAMGYNQVRFEHVESGQLLYYREDQVVARELLVITRK